MIKHGGIFICPLCEGPLSVYGDRCQTRCSKCNQVFASENSIPLLFWPQKWEGSGADVTDAIKSFYEKTPFPNYEDLDSSYSLREKAKKGIFARLLDEQIPYGSMVLEAGCGTGQLSNFLGMTYGRSVFATDICLNSLKLGQEFKEKNKIENVAFLQMNLFKPVFKQGIFDLVICNGVLHHTANPFLGFQSISRLVKKGGYIIVGLYNAWGRIPTDIRRFIFSFSGNNFKFLDPRLRTKDVSETRKNTWFQDQYKNPHESKHTIGEVLNWFDKSGFEFVNSIPKLTSRLFEPTARGNWLDHLFLQFEILVSFGKEGGFFIMIGKKK